MAINEREPLTRVSNPLDVQKAIQLERVSYYLQMYDATMRSYNRGFSVDWCQLDPKADRNPGDTSATMLVTKPMLYGMHKIREALTAYFLAGPNPEIAIDVVSKYPLPQDGVIVNEGGPNGK